MVVVVETWSAKIEQHSVARRINIIKDQLLGEGGYADLQEQIWFDDVIILKMSCCSLKSLGYDWAARGEGIQPHLLRLYRFLKKLLLTSYQDLGSALNRAISDPETRQSLIEILAFESTNTECKRALRPLKAGGAPPRQMGKTDTWYWFSLALMIIS